MLTRRHFIAASAALGLGARPLLAQDAVELGVDDINLQAQGPESWTLPPRFQPQTVAINPGFTPGSIHVDPVPRFLYHVQPDGLTARRYGVAVGRSGLQSPGTYTIRRKVEWPSWTPTQNMIAREPEIYAQYADGVPGGPNNPLGARALYLYDGGRDTYLRIHGTPQPWTVGTSASSGCVRMINQAVIELYENTPLDTPVTLHAPRS